MNFKFGVIPVLLSCIAITGCGEPKLECHGLKECIDSAKAVAAEMKMTDAETRNFVKNVEKYPIIQLLNQFKDQQNQDNLNRFADFVNHKMPDEQREKIFISAVNGKTSGEINEYVNSNKPAIEVINNLESTSRDFSVLKMMVELCRFDTGGTDCSTGLSADPAKGQRGWNLKETFGLTVTNSVITKEIKGAGYTIKVKYSIGENDEWQVEYSY